MMVHDKCFSRNLYEGHLRPSWCKGCSFFNIRKLINDTLFELQFDPLKVIIISGIGCSSRMPLFSGTFGMHTLHGRSIPVAVGAHLVNQQNKIIVTAGDGDLFSIGTGHFVHAARNNFNITVLCFDNKMFAMTKNQSSPTSSLGHVGTLSPSGTTVQPLNVLEFAISCKATFVARTSAFTPVHMNEMLSRALTHTGFSFVQIIAPCKTFDAMAFEKMKSISLFDINGSSSHRKNDYDSALILASLTCKQDKDPSVPVNVGVFYEV